jgi:hypothetical protein
MGIRVVGASTLLALAAVAFAGACDDLPDVAAGDCGNAVVDPGEDCDLYAPAGVGCGAADDENPDKACRFVCDAFSCPPGFGCGHDDVCRRGYKLYDEREPSFRMSAERFTAGDADGDGHMDLVGYGQAGVTVRFGSQDAVFSDELDLPLSFTGLPGFGHIDPDGDLDLVAPQAVGLVVFEGTEDRRYKSAAFSQIEIPIAVDSMYAMTVRDGRLFPNLLMFTDEHMCFADQCIPGDVSDPWNTTLPTPIGSSVPYTISEVAGGTIALFDLEQLPWPIPSSDEIAFGFTNDPRIWIYEVEMYAQPPGGEGKPRMVLRDVITAPGDVKHGVLSVDIDQDNDLDLLVSIEGPSGTDRVAIAHNDAGAFADPVAIGDDLAVFLNAELPKCGGGRNFPLAIGQVALDARPDFIGADGICVWSNSVTTLAPELQRWAAPTTANGWTEAIIADLNADEKPDVAATFEAQDGVDYFFGTGLFFNPAHIDTEDPPRDLQVGDFDGDFVLDLGLVEVPDDGPHTISILYGQNLGLPTDPVQVAQLEGVEQVAPFYMAVPELSLNDLITDLAVLSAREEEGAKVYSASLLLGNASRQVTSPYFLGSEGRTVVPFVAQLGRFQPPSGGAPDPTTDIFAVGYELAQLPDGRMVPGDVYAYLIEGTEGDRFQPGEVTETQYPPVQFAEGCSLVLTGDPDGDGTDAIIAIDDAIIPAGAETLCNADEHRKDQSRLLIADVETVQQGGEPALHDVPATYRKPSAAQLRDLDGDGYPELVVTFVGEGNAVERENAAVLVIWNDAGTLDLDAAVELPVPDGVFPVGAVALNTDGDAALEVAVLTHDDVRLYEHGPDRQFTADPEPAFALEQRATKASQFVNADLNGDGVEDLVVTIEQDVHVYLARQPDARESLEGDQPLAP